MGLDSSKNPHMMYGNETDYILPPPDSGENILLTIRFANWNGSTWNKQTVFSNVSTYGNMILDSKGYPHFIYTQAYQPQNAISSLNYTKAGTAHHGTLKLLFQMQTSNWAILH